MFSVFNANLQTDMGKTIVRRHLAQSVWKELSEHMRTSSKGASEKRRLTQYVTNTVLDNNFKGTTEQFVLHFNKQFRQLDEISEDSENLPPTVKLTLLQTAVRSINDHRIVETLDAFQSTTYVHGSSTSLSYETYYDLLINACVGYDKTKKANIGKREMSIVVEFWGLPPLILFFNMSIGWFGRFVLSTVVNQNKEAWLQKSKLAKMLCTGHREFGTNRWKFLLEAKHFIF